jgi:low temperature requirement protein LtrA
VVDYAGIYFSGNEWRLPAPVHFAERHGLILLVALGESIVALGAGVSGVHLTLPVLTAALLALVVSVALWWSYFDVVAPVAERVLLQAEGVARVRLARDSYTYLHFPMVVGIIYTALGLKKVGEYVADTAHHTLADPLSPTAGWALHGGVALYLLAHQAFRLRNVGTVNQPRAVTVAAVLLLALAGGVLPALVALGALAGVLVALIVFEVVWYADARAGVRHVAGDR